MNIEEKIQRILDNCFTDIDNSKAKEQLVELFKNTKLSYGIVRWYDNEDEDVVCINKQVAEEYVREYNNLCGKEKCYVDYETWLPLKEV